MSKQTIWDELRRRGFSEVAAAAVMGNMEAESNCVSIRIQGDFSNGFERSKQYTAQVDAGNINRHEFIHEGPGGGGYGLCQWTYRSRKAGLYDLAKGQGKSIGDESAQIEWFCQELRQNEYQKVKLTLDTSQSIRECSDAIVKIYERPADQSEAALKKRADLGREIYQQFSKAEAEDPDGMPEDGYITITEEMFRVYSKAVLIAKMLKDLIDMLKEL